MASDALKQLKQTWRDACHTMWVELFALRYLEGRVRGEYALIGGAVLTELAWAPESAGRLDDLTRDAFLGRHETYMEYGVTLRIVLLSSAFEDYFEAFLATWLASRTKYWDDSAEQRTAEGHKVFGEVMKTRGMVPRVREFSNQTGAGVKGVADRLRSLADVCAMRNVIAHCGGVVDDYAATQIVTVSVAPSERLNVSSQQLIDLAADVMKIAEFFDRKVEPDQEWLRTNA